MTKSNFNPLLSTKDAAARLGLSVRTLESLRLRGGGPEFIKLGRAVRYEPHIVEAWIESHRATSTSDQRG